MSLSLAGLASAKLICKHPPDHEFAAQRLAIRFETADIVCCWAAGSDARSSDCQ